MLQVGVDSYVTVEEANSIASSTSLSTDKAYQSWEGLSDNDKEVLLRNSCSAIDSLKFDGSKRKVSQHLEFPRINNRVAGIGYALYISQFWDNTLYSPPDYDGGLGQVKKAQVINAVYAGYYNDLTTDQIGVNIQGITSKKAGPISETYNRNRVDTNDALIGIYTKKVYSLLVTWLNDARLAI